MWYKVTGKGERGNVKRVYIKNLQKVECDNKKLIKKKVKCDQRWNVTKCEMWLWVICEKMVNAANCEMSLKCEMWLKVNCDKMWNGTRGEMWQKVKCSKRWNKTKVEMWQNMKCHKRWNVKKE